MSKYPLSFLKDKIFIKHGFPFKSEFFATEGEYIVLTPGNFHEEGGFKREYGKEKFYIGEIPQDYLLKKNDLIVAMTEQAEGLLGSCAFVPDDNIYLHNQRLGFITATDDINLQYIYYLYQCNFVREQIRLTSSGSKVKHTSPDRLTSVRVPLPTRDIQTEIASVLSALDKKIDCNNRINAELEAMAKTLYDYWFVQFDFPNKDGNPYKSSGGTMQYNEELKRDIPKGWGVESLGSLGYFKNGINYSKDEIGDKIYKIVNVRDISSSSFTLQAFNCDSISLLQKNAKNYLITENSILIARSGIPGATRLIIGDISDTIYCGFIICFNPFDTKLKNYIFFNLKTQELTSKNSSAGTILKNISQDTLKDKKFFVPCLDALEAFNNRFEPIVKKMCQIQQENQELAKLRDWLLPMLMNGQVSVDAK